MNHRSVTSETRPFSGPVGDPHDQNPAAHGGVTEVDTCSCGARRQRNVNGRHEEVGAWDMPHERFNVQACAATPNDARNYLETAAGSARGRAIIEEIFGDSAVAILERPRRGDGASSLHVARLVHARLR